MNNKKTHSIAAYRFNLKEYRKKHILENVALPFPFEDIIKKFCQKMNKTFMGNNSQRAMKITSYSTQKLLDDCILHKFIVKSGKFGETLEVVDLNSDDTKIFDANYVGLYGHNVLCFEYKDEFIFIFHRISNSGCKTVFVESFNDYLKSSYGYYSSFSPCFYPKDTEINYETINPKKIILTTFSDNVSSDGSEKKTKKKQKEVMLYLNSQESLLSTILSYIKRKITKEELRAALVEYDPSYSQASIAINIGNGTSRTIECEELFDKLVDYDITNLANKIEEKHGMFGFNDLINICSKYANGVYAELVEMRKEK